jgi:integrase
MEKPFKKKKDKGIRYAPYWFRYTDENGKRRMRKGFTDKAETARLQAKLQHEADLRRRGLIDAGLEAIVVSERSDIDEHLAAFEQSIKDNSPKYVQLVMSRLKKMLTLCGFASLADIDGEQVRRTLRSLVDDQKRSLRTRNHYMQAMKEFCGWLVVTDRMQRNPVLGLKAVNTEVAIKHKRRALTADEFRGLVQAASKSEEEIQCYDGTTRARIYWTAYATGLRRNEIASLTPESFDIDGDPATVTVAAAFSKHRKKDVLPLHPGYAAMVGEWLADATPGKPLFPKLEKRRTSQMVKKDLEAAGIPYETAEGIADFHAAGRHTHITELLRNGTSLVEARALARHSDVRTTMKYTHIGLRDQAEAVKRLPLHQYGSSSCDPTGREASSPGISDTEKVRDQEDATASGNGRCVATGRELSPPVATADNGHDRVRFPPPPLFLFGDSR